MDLFAAILDLFSVRAPVGLEFERAQHFINLSQIATRGTYEVNTDKFGNVICHKPGNGPKILICAHLDEIGGTVLMVLDNGRLKFTNRGGLQARWLISEEVLIRNDNGAWINGIIGGKAAHAVPPDARDKNHSDIHDLEIYIGFDKAEDVANAGIHAGSPIVFAGEIKQLNPGFTPDIISGPSMDDLIGVITLLELMDQTAEVDLPVDLYLVATAREEVGGQGAVVAARAIQPDLIIAIDIGIVEKSPDTWDYGLKFSAAPVIVWQDSAGRTVYNTRACTALKQTGLAADIPTQDATFQFYGSDSGHAQEALGIQAVLLAIPTLFSHNVPEVSRLDGARNCAALLKAWLTQYPPEGF
jgi:endoglucanase